MKFEQFMGCWSDREEMFADFEEDTANMAGEIILAVYTQEAYEGSAWIVGRRRMAACLRSTQATAHVMGLRVSGMRKIRRWRPWSRARMVEGTS
jgi:hypothetical protein